MSDTSPSRKRKRSASSSRSRSRSRSPPRKRRDRSTSRDRKSRRSRSRSRSREGRRDERRRDDRNIKSEPNRDDRRDDRNNRDNGRGWRDSNNRPNNRDNNRDNNNRDNNTSEPFFKKRSHGVGEESDDVPESQMVWGKAGQPQTEDEEPVEKEEPNFKPSGALTKELKTVVNGVELNYFEPKDAKVPTKVYVLYPFKGDEALEPLYLRKSSFFLLGRDRIIVDIPLDHPSCSKQHAVIQFRQRTMENEFGEKKTVVRPYIIDLKSTNGTHLNGTRIDDSRYFELKHKDVLKFGFSSREFVFMDESAV